MKAPTLHTTYLKYICMLSFSDNLSLFIYLSDSARDPTGWGCPGKCPGKHFPPLHYEDLSVRQVMTEGAEEETPPRICQYVIFSAFYRWKERNLGRVQGNSNSYSCIHWQSLSPCHKPRFLLFSHQSSILLTSKTLHKQAILPPLAALCSTMTTASSLSVGNHCCWPSLLFSSPGKLASPYLLIKTCLCMSHPYWVFLNSDLLHRYTLFSIPFSFHKHYLTISYPLGPGAHRPRMCNHEQNTKTQGLPYVSSRVRHKWNCTSSFSY